MSKKKAEVLLKTDCITDKPTNVQLHPAVKQTLEGIAEEIGQPMYWVMNVAVKHLENSMTDDIKRRLQEGESLARVFNAKG